MVGPNFTELWISLDPSVPYGTTVEKIQTYLKERIKEVLSGGSAAIVVRVYGSDLGTLRATAAELGRSIATVEGVSAQHLPDACAPAAVRQAGRVKGAIMRHVMPCAFATALILVAGGAPALPQATPPWMDTFRVNLADLATAGENPYVILKPGYQLTLEGRDEGKPVRLIVTVLDETKMIAGVETRVVEERESAGGSLTEVSRNFLAIERGTANVYYFGEEVDEYKNGRVTGHEGAWQHNAIGARFGLFMPGAPAVGMRFYQELAPGVAMDRAEVISLTERLTVPAGTFERCLKTEETSPLEHGKEYKVYAPGVGLIQDGPLALVSRAPGLPPDSPPAGVRRRPAS